MHADTPRASLVGLRISAVVVVAIALSPPLPAAEPPTAELPLERMVLFNIGMGFYEHRGAIEGDRRVEMKFDTIDVNDVLKSMVVRDLDGGRMTVVSYDSPEPVSQTLKSFSIDVTRGATLGQLLRQLRGVKVRVEAPQPIEGIVLGVEKRAESAGHDRVVDVDILHLKTATGLRAIPMSTIIETRMLDEKLDKELQDALDLLARTLRTIEKKTVAITFSGQGKRRVLVGYVQEAPVWKTSYRLVLADDKPAFLQGWAIVENTTDRDWNDVGVSLVSGQPVSFQMDLYQPLFAERPVVVPQEFANLAPRLHEQSLEPAEGGRVIGGGGGFFGSFGGLGGGAGGGFGAGGGAPARAPGVVSVVPKADAEAAESAEEESLDLTKGVASAAKGAPIGELFRYSVAAPLSLARRKSAMLPIVNDDIKGTKLSLYNSEVQAEHPMNAVKLVNSTKLHWMHGPITVFDGGEYAGETQIADISPGSERLVTYALDLDVEVKPTTKAVPERLTTAKISRGTVDSTYKETRTTTYTLKNSAAKARQLLVEQSIDKDWKLIEPAKPAQQTRSLYRFAVELPPGKTTTSIVREEKTTRRELALANKNPEAVLNQFKGTAVSPAVAEALKRWAELHAEQLRLTREHDNIAGEIGTVRSEQERYRENMKSLGQSTELYNRFLKKLDQSEDRIEALRTKLEKLAPDEEKARKALEDYVKNLSIE